MEMAVRVNIAGTEDRGGILTTERNSTGDPVLVVGGHPYGPGDAVRAMIVVHHPRTVHEQSADDQAPMPALEDERRLLDRWNHLCTKAGKSIEGAGAANGLQSACDEFQTGE